MWNKYQDIIDWLSVVLGVLAICCIIGPIPTVFLVDVRDAICMGVGAWAVFYVLNVCYFRLFCRIDYDWRLVHGKTLLRVISTVILAPFIVAFFFKLYGYLDGRDLQTLFLSDGDNPNISVFYQIFFLFLAPDTVFSVIDEGMYVITILALLGIFLLNGLLVSTIVNAYDKRKDDWESGDIRYTKWQLGTFAVVIGANEVAPSVICNLLATPKKGNINNKCEGDNRYVILQTNRDAEQVRDELLSHLSEEELQRVIIYTALRDSLAELEDLHLDACTEIYVLGESTMGQTGETYHDTMNMRCVNLIAEILGKEKLEHRKVCKVMFEYQTTYSIFQFSDISQEVKDTLIFIPFNRYDAWARRVMVDGFAYADCKHHNEKEKITYCPLDGEGIRMDSDEHVHLVIVGMSKMGMAIGAQAMLQAHYVNYAQAEQAHDVVKKARTRTRITFIDTHADKEKDFFVGRYENLFSLTRHRYIDARQFQDELVNDTTLPQWEDPMQMSDWWHHLSTNGENFIDLEIEFVCGGLESKGVRRYLGHISDNANEYVRDAKLTVAVCLTQTHQAVAASLYMPVSIYEKAQNIWVYQRESADIILNLKDSVDKRYQKLRPFGMLYSEYMSDRLLYLKALLVNGVYDFQNLPNIDMADKTTYKALRVSWNALSIDKTFSNKYFIDTIYQKLRSVTDGTDALACFQEKLKDAEIQEILARCEHNRWTVQQLILGYSPCGKELDDMFQDLNTQCTTPEGKKVFKAQKEKYKQGENRIHPNICDYDHLDYVDKGAKGYDMTLNNAIPSIIALVDNHPSLRKQEH